METPLSCHRALGGPRDLLDHLNRIDAAGVNLDVVETRRLEPCLGRIADLRQCKRDLLAHVVGVVLDVVSELFFQRAADRLEMGVELDGETKRQAALHFEPAFETEIALVVLGGDRRLGHEVQREARLDAESGMSLGGKPAECCNTETRLENTDESDMSRHLERRGELELDVLVLLERVERAFDYRVDDLSRPDPVGEAHAGSEMNHRIGEAWERARDNEIELDFYEVAFATILGKLREDLDRLGEFDLAGECQVTVRMEDHTDRRLDLVGEHVADAALARDDPVGIDEQLERAVGLGGFHRHRALAR